MILLPLPQELASNGTEAFPEYAGYIAAAVSCSFLGTNLLPVKNYDVGDGKLCARVQDFQVSVTTDNNATTVLSPFALKWVIILIYFLIES